MSKEKETEEETPVKREAKGPQGFFVSPALMKQAVDLMQDELPMSKARNVVLALERCPVINMPVGGKKNGNAD